MRVLVAPASLKESLSAAEAARALAAGARRAGATTVEVPLADGGRGTLQCLAPSMGLALHTVPVTGPLGQLVQATFGYNPATATAVLEMSAASGLALVPREKRDPLRATTRGTGELVRAALEAGATRVFLGIGDSATSDGGCGAAQALGYRLLDARGHDIGPGAAGVADLAHIDASGKHARLAAAQVCVACDVDNPLVGPRGSARVFAPQKGAGPEQVEQIEAALARLAEVVERDLGLNIRTLPGGGAAGGLGAGAVAFLGARLQSGAEFVLDAVDIRQRLAAADLVLTSEGRFDGQSLGGKAPMALARRARDAGVPCIVIPGSLGPGYEPALEQGISAVFPLVRENVTLSDALARTGELLAARAEEAVRSVARARSDKGEPRAR